MFKQFFLWCIIISQAGGMIMKLLVKKSVYEELEKSHKYVSRWFKNGKWQYKWPTNQKRGIGHSRSKKNIADQTKVITGIQPFFNPTESMIDNELDRLKKLSESGNLKCPALGNADIIINDMTKNHMNETKGETRTDAARDNKAFNLPFTEEILKNGKLAEKSYQPRYDENGKEIKNKKLTYGIVGRVSYFDNKHKQKNEYVEIAVAYDENSDKYVLSFSHP